MRAEYKQKSESVDAIHKCGIDTTIDALYEEVEQKYKRRKMPNEIVLTDSLSLHSTLMGDSGHNDSTGVTKSSAGHLKGTTDDKRRNDKEKYKNYVIELTKTNKCLPQHFLDKRIKKKQLESHITKTISKQTIQSHV